MYENDNSIATVWYRASPCLSLQVTRRPGNAKAWRSENAAQVRKYGYGVRSPVP